MFSRKFLAICLFAGFLSAVNFLYATSCCADDFAPKFKAFVDQNATAEQERKAFEEIRKCDLTDEQRIQFCDHIADVILKRQPVTVNTLVIGTIAFIDYHQFPADKRAKYTAAMEKAAAAIESQKPINVHDKIGYMTAIWLLNPNREEALEFVMKKAEEGVVTAYNLLGRCESKKPVPLLTRLSTKEGIKSMDRMWICSSLQTLAPDDSKVKATIQKVVGDLEPRDQALYHSSFARPPKSKKE